MTSKAALPWVRSVRSSPGGGTVKGKALKRLQPQHADRTDLTSCLRVGRNEAQGLCTALSLSQADCTKPGFHWLAGWPLPQG